MSTENDKNDSSGWYVFEPENRHDRPSAIGLDAWNTETAGAHGRIERKADKLFYNNREIKLWGSNIGFENSCPEKDVARRITALYRKFGLNAMRHHKHLDGPGRFGFQSDGSFVKFDEEKLDRFDYFNSLMKEAGIFILHSPTFGVKFGRDDLSRVPWHAEIDTLGEEKDARISARHGWIFLAKELQDLQIEQTVKLLDHRNPYTGLRYAEDPFLFCVELFNEDSALFSGTNKRLQQSPTIRARTAEAFSTFLEEKYQDETAWREAWGGEAVIDDPDRIGNPHLANLVEPDKVIGALGGESLSEKSIVPWTNPWFFDAALTDDSEQTFLRRRMLDTMAFLYDLQNAFYKRFIESIRRMGFEGEIVTSNWQAGSLVGHLLNLHTDAQTGLVDRHNYYKGGGFHGLREGVSFNNASTLGRPGGGNYTVAFQQVEGAAFMLSEWTHEQPNEWYAEGPITLGAYGWGLQGWDVSYHFVLGPSQGFSDRLGKNTWDTSNPAILGTFPAVARMVRRMDVKESPETFHLNAHVPSLLEGKMSFRGETIQEHDEKLFSTDKAPVEALAATRVAVRFIDEYVDTPEFDLEKYLDGKTVVAANGQLRWTGGEDDEPNSGYVVINTKGTKAFVGFAPGGKTIELGDGFAVTPQAGFAVIILTADAPDKDLLTDDNIILTAMARVRNTSMQLNPEGNVVTQAGNAPIRMEPVKAEIALPFPGQLEILDHDGIEPCEKRVFESNLIIDGCRDKTPFYRIIK
ncbi:MAG: hypothetical protein ACOCVL_03025 [Candidatus Sumerlaeota bacterium]